MTDCIIFDFDGTLADTAAGILATVKETFRRLGFQGADDERIRPTIGLVLETSPTPRPGMRPGCTGRYSRNTGR